MDNRRQPFQFTLASVFFVATLVAATTRLLAGDGWETGIAILVLAELEITWLVFKKSDRKRRPFTTMLVIHGVALVACVGNYFSMSFRKPNFVCRNFPYRWMCDMYRPAAKLESKITGHTVALCYGSILTWPSRSAIYSIDDYLD